MITFSMNYLPFVILTTLTAGATMVIAQMAGKMVRNQGLRGFSAIVPTVAISLSAPLMLMLFGDYFINAQLLIWPVLLTAVIAVWAGVSQRH